MTPKEFVEAMRELHEPILPYVTQVRFQDPTHPRYNGGAIQEATIEDKANFIEPWCAGCGRLANDCHVQTLLNLVDGDETCQTLPFFLKSKTLSLSSTDLRIMSGSALFLAGALLLRSAVRNTFRR